MNQPEPKLAEFDGKFKDIQYSFDLPVVKSHLTFLKAFVRIAEGIDSDFAVKDPSTGIKSPSPPMRVYLSRAVYRYHTWITKALKGRSDGPLKVEEIPPIDVLFILHAHMIAPSRFDDDVTLHFPKLGKIGAFPLSDVVHQIDVETGRYDHLPEQAETWQRLTGLPFHPSDKDGFPEPQKLSPPFSTDLVYKSLLQVDFGTRLARRGLFDRSFLVNGEATMGVIPQLYQAFLKLALVPNMPRIFPSPPVDLIWHTHQLQGMKYKSQVLDLVGVFVDHVSMDQIAPAETDFVGARSAWQAFLKSEGMAMEVKSSWPDEGLELTCTASGSQALGHILPC